MKTLGIIPARAGSKRVPQKNIKPIGGKPLVARTIDAALQATKLDQVVVSSDDPQVLAIAGKYTDIISLERPRELATDTALAIEYVRHSLDTLEKNSDTYFDVIVILQPSSPFTLPEDIDGTLALLEEHQTDSAVSVMQTVHLHPAKLKLLNGHMLVPYIEDESGRMAVHQLPKVYTRNGSVYASRRNVIDAGNILSDNCCGYIMPRERSIDIDDQLDWYFAEFLASRLKENEQIET